jgi:processive 1,2-diacylglycerol beta-glucosyltransferase
MRLRHGLAPDRTTCLVSAGGFGVGPIDQLVRSLLPLQHPAQIVAVCGRSEELHQRLTALAAEVPPVSPVTLLPVGYTTMDEYMAAADLMIGKPGGLTTSEALARGLPMVIVNPIPGQEDRNADYLLEEGAAIRGNNLPALAWKLDRLLADRPPPSAALRQNALRIARPHAARDVVAALGAGMPTMERTERR